MGAAVEAGGPAFPLRPYKDSKVYPDHLWFSRFSHQQNISFALPGVQTPHHSLGPGDLGHFWPEFCPLFHDLQLIFRDQDRPVDQDLNFSVSSSQQICTIAAASLCFSILISRCSCKKKNKKARKLKFTLLESKNSLMWRGYEQNQHFIGCLWRFPHCVWNNKRLWR